MTTRLGFLLSTLLLVAPACSSESLSTSGQLIECDTTSGACHAVDEDDGAPNSCVDIDEDGDGDDHDEAETESEDEHPSGDDSASLTGDSDDDDDGTADDADADDDNDGIPDDRDCDELPGHDDDDAGDGA